MKNMRLCHSISSQNRMNLTEEREESVTEESYIFKYCFKNDKAAENKTAVQQDCLRKEK